MIVAIDVARIVLILDILKIEPTWLTNSLDVSSERNKEIRTQDDTEAIWSEQLSMRTWGYDVAYNEIFICFGQWVICHKSHVSRRKKERKKLVTGELDIWIWGPGGNVVTGNKMV